MSANVPHGTTDGTTDGTTETKGKQTATTHRQNVCERLVDLALVLARRTEQTGGISADEVRSSIYPTSPNTDAADKMFARDRELLQSAGLAIAGDNRGIYRLVTDASYCEPITLDADEAAALVLAGFALLDEPLFPLPLALRLALTKLSGLLGTAAAGDGGVLRRLAGTARLTAGDDEAAAGVIMPETLLRAVSERRVLTMRYVPAPAGTAGVASAVTDTDRVQSSDSPARPTDTAAAAIRTVEPYGLFLLGARWYFVARDCVRDGVRTYCLARVRELSVGDKAGAFQIPDDFDVRDWARLPFEIGTEPTRRVTLLIPAGHVADISGLTRGRGSLSTAPAGEPDGDGTADDAMEWTVDVRDTERLLTFVLEHHLFPAPHEHELRAQLVRGLEQVVADHG
ncbi:MAG: WYL domain-containing protein [Actinomycetes bacterium]|nr:WYL domain-containing protein [Actinomycetes bacterium]